jgi:predicted nucleic acid-binding protein
MYVADAHVYLLAARDEAFRNELTSFVREHGPLCVSAVVIAEVLVAVPDTASDAAVVRNLEAGVPMLAPTEDDWIAAARAIARLGGGAVTKGRSFWNDALLAAQCARLGATLITDNEADYRRLRTHLGVRTAPPFP